MFLSLFSVNNRSILGRKPELSDMADVDSHRHRSLRWMLENSIVDTIFETFSVAMDHFGTDVVEDLIPGMAYI